jgi:hypothetical protein
LQSYVDAYLAAGRKLGFSYSVVHVSKPEDYDSAYETLAARGCQAVVEHGSAMIYVVMGKLVALA